MKYELPKLPYAYNALEPYIDERTMELHHTKHHATYVAKLNEALEKFPEFQTTPLEELMLTFHKLPEALQAPIRNHGGGHLNHSLFWNIMATPAGKVEPVGDLAEALKKDLGGFLHFRGELGKIALGHFGSGWAWLVLDNQGKLLMTTTANQDSPILEGQKPILGLDVWEHAYYLKYQNRRQEYIENWWRVVNWTAVEQNFISALGWGPGK